MEYVDNDGAANIASKTLHRNILNALDFIGYIHWQIVVYRFPASLD